jgi:hypothetical protein
MTGETNQNEVITESMGHCFLTSKTLYADFAYLDPKNCLDMRNGGLMNKC